MLRKGLSALQGRHLLKEKPSPGKNHITGSLSESLAAWHRRKLQGRAPMPECTRIWGSDGLTFCCQGCATLQSKSAGMAPELNRRSRELGSAGELLPHQTLQNCHLFPSHRLHTCSRISSNMKVTVTFLGQHCTALQSLTFTVGMRELLSALSPQQHVYSRHPHRSSWLRDRYTDVKCPKIPAAFYRSKYKLEPLRVFNMPAEVKLWKGKTFGTLPGLSQPPTAQAASIHAAATDGNIHGRCSAFLMSQQSHR